MVAAFTGPCASQQHVPMHHSSTIREEVMPELCLAMAGAALGVLFCCVNRGCVSLGRGHASLPCLVIMLAFSCARAASVALLSFFPAVLPTPVFLPRTCALACTRTWDVPCYNFASTPACGSLHAPTVSANV
eukprot:1148228-Pelagomonas_calceolata.AAC.3